MVLGANDSPAVRTLIVGPPTIYGRGRGPTNQRSIQVPGIVDFTLKNGFAPIQAPGLTEWDNVHSTWRQELFLFFPFSPLFSQFREWRFHIGNNVRVITFETCFKPPTPFPKKQQFYLHTNSRGFFLAVHDLGDFFVLAVDAALDPAKSRNPEIFGPRAYFFLENGTHRWSDVSKWVAAEAAKQGLIPEPIAKEIDIPRLGTNSKSVAARAGKYLGWAAKSPSLKETIPDVVASEAKKLGKT